jgi:uncharacterized membrane protein
VTPGVGMMMGCLYALYGNTYKTNGDVDIIE